MSANRDERENTRRRIVAALDGSLHRRSPADHGSENPAIAAATNAIEVPAPEADPLEMASTLSRQAGALDVIFTECVKEAAKALGGYRDPFELYMRFALKAQAQCRVTAVQASALRQSQIRAAQRANGAQPHQPAASPQKFDDQSNGIRQNA